ncbi:MAG: hypothetical protein LBT73_03700 [Tannerellaceae bacterium]|jgi:hypothetical protein|nr:hypothetical protein [Tannerellaceae bacterium]
MERKWVRVLVSVCVGVAALGVSEVRGEIKFGGKVGIEEMKGMHVGGMVEVMLPVVGIGAEGSVLYVKEWGGIEESRLEVPVRGKVKIGVWGLKVYGVTGPRLTWAMSREWGELVEVGAAKRYAKQYGVSWDIGCGVELLGHLQAGVEAGVNLTDDYEGAGVDVVSVLGGNQWGYRFTLAYLF